MLNPVLSNTKVVIGHEFFPEELVSKYDNYLYSINFPFKTLESYIHETIQNISIPGIQLNTVSVESMPNLVGNVPGSDTFFHPTHTETYEGTVSQIDTDTDKTATITFKNTIINWMYMFEHCYEHYKRKRITRVGSVYVIMYNAAEVPVLQFQMQRCFISNIPGLEFAFNEGFSESKTFDVTFTFNQLDIKFILPDMKQKEFKEVLS